MRTTTHTRTHTITTLNSNKNKTFTNECNAESCTGRDLRCWQYNNFNKLDQQGTVIASTTTLALAKSLLVQKASRRNLPVHKCSRLSLPNPDPDRTALKPDAAVEGRDRQTNLTKKERLNRNASIFTIYRGHMTAVGCPNYATHDFTGA